MFVEADCAGPFCQAFVPERALCCRGHADDVVDVAWSPEGPGLVSASIQNMVTLWDTAKGERKVCVSSHRGCLLLKQC